jgi:hypothetical protein
MPEPIIAIEIPETNQPQTVIRGSQGQAFQPQGILRNTFCTSPASFRVPLIAQSALSVVLNEIIMESLTRPMRFAHVCYTQNRLPSDHHIDPLTVKIADLSRALQLQLPASARSLKTTPAQRSDELFHSIFIHHNSISRHPVSIEPV